MTLVNPIHTGPRRRWSSELLPALCILLILAAAVSVPFAIGLATWSSHLAMRQEWAIRGPACREVRELSVMGRGAKPPKPFTYKGARFAAQMGDIYCEAVPDKGWFPRTTHAVCQFSNPLGVEVQTPSGRVVYETGMGRRATVTVLNGRPSCVVGGWFGD